MSNPSTQQYLAPIRALIDHIYKAGHIYEYEPIFEQAKQALPALERSADENERLRAVLNLERQRLVSWADRLNKRCKNEAADEVWERVEAIDRAMRPADEHGAEP
jgi:hypothetical protein